MVLVLKLMNSGIQKTLKFLSYHILKVMYCNPKEKLSIIVRFPEVFRKSWVCMAEWVRWQLDFCMVPKVEGSSPLAVELFLPPKEKQIFLQIRFFLKIFYKNTYLGVKNHGESEFDV